MFKRSRKFRSVSAFRPLIFLAVLAVVAVLVLRIDTAALSAALSQVSTLHIAAVLSLVQFQIVVSALRWRFTAERLGQRMTIGRAIREYYVATLLNQSLPGGMAGDALRAYRMRADGAGGWKQPAKAIVFERLSGQIAFFAFLGLGLFGWPSLIRPQMPERPGLAALALAAVFVLLLIGAWKLGKAQGLIRTSGIAADVRTAFLDRKAWAVQLGMSFAVVLAYVAAFLIASDAVGAQLPMVAGVTVVPLALLAMLIPSGLGGWGSREAAAMALWPLVGATTSEGLAASLVYGGLSLAGALPGLFFLGGPGVRETPQA